MSGAVRYWQDLISESTWDALRRSRPLEAQSAANSGKRSYFWPDDADFAMAFRELSNDEIDQIVAHVAASPDLVSQGIKEFPEALRVLGQLRPTVVATALLLLSCDAINHHASHSTGQDARGALSAWRRRNQGIVPCHCG